MCGPFPVQQLVSFSSSFSSIFFVSEISDRFVERVILKCRPGDNYEQPYVWQLRMTAKTEEGHSGGILQEACSNLRKLLRKIINMISSGTQHNFGTNHK